MLNSGAIALSCKSSCIAGAMVVALAICLTTSASAQRIVVPGTSNPWLAGMPDGSVAGGGYDTAPAQSPVLVPVVVAGGMVFTFAVTGSVSNTPFPLGLTPDGGNFYARETPPENGIADLVAPINSLVGVFLDSSRPDAFPTPGRLDFAATGLDFASVAPALRQPFFIGDGLAGTGSGRVQRFIAPPGAARLYLGTMDGYGWIGNTGRFEVDVGCPADFNRDGGVDGGDVGAFFAAWEIGVVEADVNLDGGVDGQDLFSFFERWQAGC